MAICKKRAVKGFLIFLSGRCQKLEWKVQDKKEGVGKRGKSNVLSEHCLTRQEGC